ADGEPTGFDYWRLADEVDLRAPLQRRPPLKPTADYRLVGRSVARLDLPDKLSGAPFINDLSRPGMLHARTLRQPARGARLAHLDEAAVRRAAGRPVQILRVGDFVAFVDESEAAVEAAAQAAAANPDWIRWADVRRIDPGHEEPSWLRGRPSRDRTLGAPPADSDRPGQRLVSAVYSRPYVAHASLAPSCALAEYHDGRFHIWSHGQGMHPLVATLADALGVPADSISAEHVQGSGCYGHNGADDAALDAALIARELPGRCIRVQWRRQEEFGFEPLGTPMLIELRVWLDGDGRPCDWTTELWSGAHVQRPGLGGGNLLASEALPVPAPEPEVADPPESRGGGATRNAVPLYDLPAHRIIHHLLPHLPLRTSALRGLGALPNVFAIESMLDELAALSGRDPLDYRLALLCDARARRVLQCAADSAGWSARGEGGQGHGLGLGFARYKNRAAYAAVVAEVRVENEVRVQRVWCAADAGLVINPDGVRNQLEGGIVQGASWALKERVRLDERGVSSVDWESYPILRFSEVPEIEVELVAPEGQPDEPHRSLGAGECTVGPTAAAIGNAVAHALGARIRDMPLDRERIMAALLR
ncbi:MAG: xanthine dehydrogenase family protein molybdopterin-binding subunit, partial [Gammaproteobacteria bacterium]|nr:xanthine dehydrogenase family protein molybdopterin-binding subunit [Gammaproteobacteria bacterium]